MNTLILIILAIIMILWFKGSNKQPSNVKSKRQGKTSFADRQVQQQSVQLLESLEIIQTTTALDTLIGRIDFISHIYPTFLNGRNSSRYLSDVQIGIDNYKTMYYDRILKEVQASLLINPNTENLKEFYADCIVLCYVRYVEKQELEIDKLVRWRRLFKPPIT